MKIIGVLGAAALAVAVLCSAPEIKRYLKMRAM